MRKLCCENLLIVIASVYVFAGSAQSYPVFDGVSVSSATNIQRYPQLISDGAGGAIITWEDTRGGGASDVDVFAQRIDISANTFVGSNMDLVVSDGVASNRLRVTFTSILTNGTTTLNSTSSGPPLSPGVILFGDRFDVNTSALHSGSIDLGFYYTVI